jgi:hypothetical protein
MPAIIRTPVWPTVTIQHHTRPVHRDGPHVDAAIHGSVHHAGQTQSEKAAVTAPSLGPARGIFWGFLFSLCAWPLLFGLALFIFG